MNEVGRNDYRLARYALRHPILVAVMCGLLLGVWGAILYRSVPAAIISGVITFAFIFVLWMPRYGPARLYTQRVLRGHDPTN